MKKLLFALAIFRVCTLHAQDRLFTYTHQSSVLNKSQKELEIWTTISNGREHYFRGLKHRIEFEMGLGGNLQTAFYLNYGYSKAIVENAGVESVSEKKDYSFSNEFKYKLSDPVANVIGSALYFEYTLGTSETELEGKLIFDKQIGKTLHAFNVVGEYEIENEFEPKGVEIEVETETEKVLELYYAMAYKIKEGLSLGFEVKNKNQFDSKSKWEASVLSAGPCFAYSNNGFWINLTMMPQITNLKGSGLELKSHEKFQTRLIFSYVF